jgi:tetratricopeptide (TPR) repeat protein
MKKRYIPNLIPERHRVLPEYFEEQYSIQNRNSTKVLMWIVSIILFLSSIVTLPVSLGFSFCLTLTAFLICPWGHQFLEKNLRFTLTQNLKVKTIGIISVFTFLTSFGYFNNLKVIRQHEITAKIKQDRIEEEIRINNLLRKKEIEANDKKRLDSLTFLISQAKNYQKLGKYHKAINHYLKAQTYSTVRDKNVISFGLANSYFESKNYKKAIEFFNGLEGSDVEIYYKKGICSKKIGDISSAIRNFKRAADFGHKKSEKEYNQVNPIIRHILYYQTVCCDGSYSPSNAKGRGACSHHGGVCNWNKPIYEEHRKYEESNF